MFRAEHIITDAAPFASFDEAQAAHLALAEQNEALEAGWREARAVREASRRGEDDPEMRGWRESIARLRRGIEQYEWRLAATGARLASPDQRLLAQSLLDFWGLRQSELRLRTYELRAASGRSFPQARPPRPKTLLPYDEANAPELTEDANPFAAILPQTTGDPIAGQGAQVAPAYADQVSSADDIRALLLRSASSAGLQIGSEAVGGVLRQVALYPEPLVLARWAFDWLWRNRDRNRIPDALVAELGDPALKLAETAEATYVRLPDTDRQGIARRLFLSMVCQLGESYQRLPLEADRLAAIGDPMIVAEVIAPFERAGIVTRMEAKGGQGERLLIAHDALLLHWQRLRDWLGERGRDDRDLALVHAAALSWQRSGSDDDLPTGEALVRAQAFADRDPLVSTYVQAGRAYDVRRAQRLRRIYTIVSCAVLVLLFVVVAITQWRSERLVQESVDQQAAAQKGADAASTGYAAAQQVDVSPDIAPPARVAVPDAPGTKGWLWAGSSMEPQLSDVKGALVDPSQIHTGAKLSLRTSMYLRAGPPSERASDPGTRKPTVGIGNAGFFVTAIADPSRHDFKGTTQYWLPVRLIPRIFIQLPATFAEEEVKAIPRGSRLKVEDWLVAQGYDVPPVQWLGGIAGLHEIRYYHTQDRAPAEDLAARLNGLTTGSGVPPVTARLMTDPALVARVREGVLEVWLGTDVAMSALAAIRATNSIDKNGPQPTATVQPGSLVR